MGLAVAILFFMGFAGCGVACFILDQALKNQRHELNETRAQVLALKQALGVRQHDLSETREQLAAAHNQIADAQKKNQTLAMQLTEMQSKLQESKTATATTFAPIHAPIPFAGMAPDVPATDSVEGKLRSEGKSWERTDGPPVAGGYVQDILEGRLNQPKGRGCIGMVVSLAANPGGGAAATVDFGHGYVVGIATSELSPVRLDAPGLR
jgi:uncharacterized protein (DUF697 family)